MDRYNAFHWNFVKTGADYVSVFWSMFTCELENCRYYTERLTN